MKSVCLAESVGFGVVPCPPVLYWAHELGVPCSVPVLYRRISHLWHWAAFRGMQETSSTCEVLQ